MSNPIAPVENPSAKPRQMEDAGRMNSGGSQSGVRAESGKSSARQVPPDSLTVSQRGPVTLVEYQFEIAAGVSSANGMARPCSVVNLLDRGREA